MSGERQVIVGLAKGQMMVRWFGEVQITARFRVKSQKYSELDVGGHETCE